MESGVSPFTSDSHPSNQAAFDHRQSLALSARPRTDRIEVEILDHRLEGPRLDNVPIETPAGLPEVAFEALATTRCHPGNPMRGVLDQIPNRPESAQF